MKSSIKEATDRFVDIAFKEDKNIKDLGDLRNALISAFDSPRGHNATGQFNDEELLHFFKSKECKDKVEINIYNEERENLEEKNITLKAKEKLTKKEIDKEAERRTEKRIKEMYGEIERGEFEVQREIPKGVPITKQQLRIVYTPKKVSTKPHIRKGKSVKSYNKGYSKWSNTQITFLKVRKQKKIKPMQIITQYNTHFKSSPRTESSIRTKVYRI